jgi:hypothetical protein
MTKYCEPSIDQEITGLETFTVLPRRTVETQKDLRTVDNPKSGTTVAF